MLRALEQPLFRSKSKSALMRKNEEDNSAKRRFWKEQKVAALIAIAGGLLFWFGHGLLKGVLFALVVMCVQQLPIVFDWWRGRR